MGRVVEVSDTCKALIFLLTRRVRPLELNRIILVGQIFGPESSGKTTLALHAIAEAQKAGKITVFIDAEHALDKQYAKASSPLECMKCDT